MAKRIDDNRLLPCPFCGEDAAIWYFPQHDRPLLREAYYVGCTNDNCGCELEHPGAFKSLDDAVSAWNKRAKEPTTKNNSSELEKNSKKLEKGTTKNDLGVDCINRATVLHLINDVNNSDGFKDYSQYEYLFDQVDMMPSVTPQLSVPEVTALAEWTEKLTKASEDAYNKGYADGMKELGSIMTKDKFKYALTACGCLFKDGKTWYEHNELIKCFEDLGLFEQEPTIKALGEELRKARKGIADEKVLIGYNMAVAIYNKHLGGSEE